VRYFALPPLPPRYKTVF